MRLLEYPIVVGKYSDIGVVRASEEKSIQQKERKTDKNDPDRPYLLVFNLLKKCGYEEYIAHIHIESDPGDLGNE